jgi:hypothetical protein
MRHLASQRDRRRVVLATFTIMAALALGAATPSAGAASARPTSLATESRTVALLENAHLRAGSAGGNTIHEEGEATGTFRCRITVDLRIVSTNKVTATFTVTPAGGTVTGKGSARFVARGAYGYLGGVLSIVRGTGKFSHASGTNIGLSGKFNRETFAATVQVHGAIHL